jgi:HPt (histidine-containing phosphotransfer) domain-containing protein
MTADADPMEALRGRFRDRLAAERAALAEAVERSDRETFRAICHRIAGAGGMFGFADLSQLASRVEEAIDAGVACRDLREPVAQLLSDIDDATRA